MSIRWKKGDYIKLGRAVANFNRQIQKLENETSGLMLPDKYDYSYLKENIQSRRDLNNIIKSLKRIEKSDALDVYELQSGLKITKYERRELGIQQRSAKSQLTHQQKILDSTEFRVGTTETKHTMSQMQSTSKNNLAGKKQLISKDIESLNKDEFVRFKSRANKYSKDSYYAKQNSVWKASYLQAINDYIAGMPGARQLYDTLEAIPDKDFYGLSQQDKITSQIEYIYEISYTSKISGITDAQYMLDRLINAWEFTLKANKFMKEHDNITNNTYENDITNFYEAPKNSKKYLLIGDGKIVASANKYDNKDFVHEREFAKVKYKKLVVLDSTKNEIIWRK